MQPAGQHASVWYEQTVIWEGTQRAEQSAALPTNVICKQGEGESGQVVGQAAGPEAFLSQVSPGSTTPSPQLPGQSVLVAWVAPAGQQPSPEICPVMRTWAQAASQAAPVRKSVVQALPSSQPTGQPPGAAEEMPTSQDSPDSRTPSPQAAAQSVSTAFEAPGGQQPSPEIGAVMG